jgi:hypothetical protein
MWLPVSTPPRLAATRPPGPGAPCADGRRRLRPAGTHTTPPSTSGNRRLGGARQGTGERPSCRTGAPLPRYPSSGVNP